MLAAVAAVFGEHAVSIRSMEQVGLGPTRHAWCSSRTSRAEADVQATLAGLGRASMPCERIGGLLRVIGHER